MQFRPEMRTPRFGAILNQLAGNSTVLFNLQGRTFGLGRIDGKFRFFPYLVFKDGQALGAYPVTDSLFFSRLTSLTNDSFTAGTYCYHSNILSGT